MAELHGKVALITGSAQGIGRQIALAMARAGAEIVVLDLTLDKCHSTIEEIRAVGVKAIAIDCDVTNEEQVSDMIKQVITEFGCLDILVNNAGWQYVGSVENSNLEQWQKTIAVNLLGPFLCSRAVIPHMKRQENGVIINITSRAGRVPKANAAAYGASKFGLNGFTLCLNLEVMDHGIRVLALAPPSTQTPLTRKIVKDLHPGMDISAWPDGSEFGEVVAWFASDEANELDGIIIETGGLRP